MKIRNVLVAALIGAGSLAATAGSASAYVACNREGDCWHTETRVRVPNTRFEYHNDDWYFHQKWESDRDHHYRDYHTGRGYYRNGLWIQF
jgi:hypothetical protein